MIREFIGSMIFILSFFVGLYVGLCLLFVKPIVICILVYKAGMFTLKLIGWNIFKFCFAVPSIWFFHWLGATIRLFVIEQRICKWLRNQPLSWIISSVGQSSRLISGRSSVRVGHDPFRSDRNYGLESIVDWREDVKLKNPIGLFLSELCANLDDRMIVTVK